MIAAQEKIAQAHKNTEFFPCDFSARNESHFLYATATAFVKFERSFHHCTVNFVACQLPHDFDTASLNYLLHTVFNSVKLQSLYSF